jgi:hypothetical protein
MSSVRIFIFFSGIFFSCICFSQIQKDLSNPEILTAELSSKQDEADIFIAKKLLNDTLNFYRFPNDKFLDSIIPNRQITYWEVNSCGFIYCRNLYNSKRGKNDLQVDSLVLSKSEKGLGSTCPPGWCTWYISARLKDGNIATIADWKSLKFFIGNIDNEFDAYFWLVSSINLPSQVPFDTTDSSKYKKYQDGYLIRTTMRIKDCTVTDAEVLYFVGKNKKITFIQVLNIREVGGCI